MIVLEFWFLHLNKGMDSLRVDGSWVRCAHGQRWPSPSSLEVESRRIIMDVRAECQPIRDSVLWLACGNFVLALWASRQVQFCHRPVGRHRALGGRQASCRVGSHKWKMKREKFVLVEVFNLNEQLVKRSFRIGIPLHQKKNQTAWKLSKFRWIALAKLETKIEK